MIFNEVFTTIVNYSKPFINFVNFNGIERQILVLQYKPNVIKGKHSLSQSSPVNISTQRVKSRYIPKPETLYVRSSRSWPRFWQCRFWSVSFSPLFPSTVCPGSHWTACLHKTSVRPPVSFRRHSKRSRAAKNMRPSPDCSAQNPEQNPHYQKSAARSKSA